ncbi:hypothetical protein ACFLYV_01830 [Chloroflexota bacterium]
MYSKPPNGWFPANCQTTAMSILPHRDIETAMKLVLSLDVPFWPQLPNIDFYSDMYVQAMYDFPGVNIDFAEEQILFNTSGFTDQLGEYSGKMQANAEMPLEGQYGQLLNAFLEQDLANYPAIHGQMAGPINLGFRVNDENGRPLVYDDGIRSLLYDFVARKYATQLKQLRKKNQNAFVWMDEPGMIWVFSGLSGYNDIIARQEYGEFLAGMDGLKALHLCTNINLPYLLSLGIKMLSFDAYQLEIMPKDYTKSIAEFLRAGGILSWGIVPTEPLGIEKETPGSLAQRLVGYWEVITANTDLAAEDIARGALLAPAKCCVKSLEFANAEATDSKPAPTRFGCGASQHGKGSAEEQSVTLGYEYLKQVSRILREKYHL